MPYIDDNCARCELRKGSWMAKHPHRCVFCERGPLTKEHVVSDWAGRIVRTPMLNHRGIETDIGVTGTTTSERLRTGHPSSRRVKGVCEACNNGWMKGIVDTCKPIALPLIEGAACRLMSADQSILSSWIATAVIVSEFEDEEHVTIPAGTRYFPKPDSPRL